VVLVLGPQPPGRHRGRPQALPLAPTVRHPQSLLAPEALHLLAVHGPPLLAQRRPCLAVAPAWVTPRERPQLLAQGVVATTAVGRPPLRGAVLSGNPARPPFREREPVLQHADRLAPARRAHQFPFATSRSASSSSSLSATSRLSRAFSRSSSRSRFASSA